MHPTKTTSTHCLMRSSSSVGMVSFSCVFGTALVLPYQSQKDMQGVQDSLRAVVSMLVYLPTPVPSTEDETLDYLSGWG